MQLTYSVKIENPSSHIVSVKITGEKATSEQSLELFIPSWSPGSYLMREYGKNIRTFNATTSNGEVLYHEQTDKGVYRVDWPLSELSKADDKFEVAYDIYCHELTVRTSHVDESHAFLHGPSFLMGVLGHEMPNPTIKIDIHPSWSKISTGLKEISDKRDEFIYTAKNYDELIDAPFEIGCHETDGFSLMGKDHELAFTGPLMVPLSKLKEDMKTITAHVAEYMGGMPYEEKYTYLTHFAPGMFGGLEHLNSTALVFCPFKLGQKKGYIKWLELVAHEYFHTWNVKRIRPKELGPFDYLTEAKTRMHWLTEGLTSFMDQLFVYQCGFIDAKGYAELMVDNIKAYESTPGRKFHSLEDSSFNAWIKLYRPDENSKNSSVSYYLKGGLVFFVLNVLLYEKGKTIKDLIGLLWKSYEARPEKGLEDIEVYEMIRELAGPEVLSEFQTMVTTTNDIDFANILSRCGFEAEYETPETLWFGFNPKYTGDRVIVNDVRLDSPAYKSGINAGDEIVALNGMRVLKGLFTDLTKSLEENKKYTLTVSRLNQLREIEISLEKSPRILKGIKVVDEDVVKGCFGSN